MGKRKCRVDADAIMEAVGDDPELIFQAVRHLTRIADTTTDPDERGRIRAVLAKLCGDASDPGIAKGESQSF